MLVLEVRRDAEDLLRAEKRPGHHRRMVGDEVLWRRSAVNVGNSVENEIRERRVVPWTGKVTWNVTEGSAVPEDGRSGRIVRRTTTTGAGNRRPCARLRGSRIDSLDEVVEDGEAHLSVALAWRGATCSGGAMARTVVAVLLHELT
jgi:hypothetical protein